MSTESGKTCGECKENKHPDWPDKGHVVYLCPLHDGSMAERAIELLREIHSHIEYCGCEGVNLCRIAKFLAEGK